MMSSRDDLLALGEKLLEIPSPLIEEAIALELADGTVIADRLDEREAVFLSGLYRSEQNIAMRLLDLAAGAPPWGGINADSAIPWVEGRTGLTLAESQRAAVRLAISSKLLVITGGPGVGKTTLVNSILKILAVKGLRLALAAPSGRGVAISTLVHRPVSRPRSRAPIFE